ncbi:hypothetical protein [Serratia rhizosphaerae]|uniref:hypothetical protein n=1 Tax=Serratia rhizosphaerae TaxID=2597702 RepID=UPI00135C30C9|nr:hypothetical protein [Serratia rhizosphaerae]
MKRLIIILSALALSACSATLVSYRSDSDNACPPMVSVQSLGSSVTVTDGTICKVVGE